MNRSAIPAVLILLFLLCLPVSAISAVIGEEVYISGSKPPRAEIYLMVTGPNLPSCGAELESIHTAVQNGVSGSFTTASESSDTTWFYRWDTSKLAGISPGTYLVYAITQPANACNLAGQEYSVVPVTLTTPSLYVETPVETATTPEATLISAVSTATVIPADTIPPETPAETLSETESAPFSSAGLLPLIIALIALASVNSGTKKKE